MKKKTGKLIMVGVLTLGIMMTSGCAKVKGMLPGGGGKDSKAVVAGVAKPTTLGEYQDAITQRASLIIAEKYEIDVTPEAVGAFISNVVGDDLDNPTQLFDINNNPAVIKSIIGDTGYVKSFIPPYVEEKLSQILEAKYTDVSEEELEVALVEYKDYLDSLGIQEDAREDYVKHVISLESMTMQVDQEYYAAYSQAAVEMLKQHSPEYYETLTLQE